MAQLTIKTRDIIGMAQENIKVRIYLDEFVVASNNDEIITTGYEGTTNSSGALVISNIVPTSQIDDSEGYNIDFIDPNGKIIFSRSFAMPNDNVDLKDLLDSGVRYVPQGTPTPGGGSSTFKRLTDTPNSYSGASGKVVQVNSSENGLEFSEAGEALSLSDELPRAIVQSDDGDGESAGTGDKASRDDHIHSVAEQVQANWGESNQSSPDYIQNKPNIPAAQVPSDWNASSGVSRILNKPTIPIDTTLWKGNWQTQTAYAIGDIVVNSNKLYIAVAVVPNTNTSAPTDGTTWNELSVGEAGDITNASISGNTITLTRRSGTTFTLAIPPDAFTDTYKTKLDGIEPGAEVNPRNVALPFRTEDGDSVIEGVTHFYKSDNSQWQGGSPSEIAAIEIHPTQFSLTQNPQTANPNYTGWHSLIDNLIEKGGSSIWTFQKLDNTNPNNIVAGELFRVQTETLSKNDDGNYVLSNIVYLMGSDTASGSGYSWQVVSAFAPPSGADAVIGVLAKNKLPSDIVYTEQLVGKETDRYASYTNGFIGSGYRTGSWCLFNQSSGVPTNANAIGQPDIEDRSTNGIVAFGSKLRADRDPNHFVEAPANIASDYANGDVFYASVWNRPNVRMVITLTSDGTLVGSGDAQYIYATATWDEVVDVSDVVDNGDYFLIAKEEPTKIPIKIPARDVIGEKWVLTDGSNVTDALKDAVQGDNEEVTLANTFRIDNTNVDRYVQLSEPGSPNLNTIRIRIPATDTQNKTDLERLLQNGAWVEIGDYLLDITSNATVSQIGTGITFAANYTILSGTKPTGSTPRTVRVVGEDVHRGELARQSFKEETPSIAGKGGSAGRVWKWAADNLSNWGQVAWSEITGKPSIPDTPSAPANQSEAKKYELNVPASSGDATWSEAVDNDTKATSIATFTNIVNESGTWNEYQGMEDSGIYSVTIFENTSNHRTQSAIFMWSDVPANQNIWLGVPSGGDRAQIKKKSGATDTIQLSVAGGFSTTNIGRIVKLN